MSSQWLNLKTNSYHFLGFYFYNKWVPTGRARGTHFVVPRLASLLGTTPSQGPRPEAAARVEGSSIYIRGARVFACRQRRFL